MEAEERGGREGKKKRTGEGTENGRGRRGRGREGRTKQAGTPEAELPPADSWETHEPDWRRAWV